MLDRDTNKHVFDNGLTLLTEVKPGSTKIDIVLHVDGGAKYEESMGAKPGVAHFVEHMLFQGANGKNYEEIGDLVAALGEFNAYTGQEQVDVVAQVLEEDLYSAIELIADLVTAPEFPEDRLETERGVILQEYCMYKDNNNSVFSNGFYGHLFGMKDIIGTQESITSINSADCHAYWSKVAVPARIKIAICGDIVHQDIVALISEFFGSWEPKVNEPVDELLFSIDASQDSVEVTINDNAVHCPYAIAYRFRPPSDEQAAVAIILTSVIGDGFGSLLFNKLRNEMGAVYSTRAYNWDFNNAQDAVLIVTGQTEFDKIGDVIEASKAIIMNATDAITDEHVERVKKSERRQFLFRMDSVRVRNNNHIDRDASGIDECDIYAAMPSVTADDVRKLAKWLAEQKPVVGFAVRDGVVAA